MAGLIRDNKVEILLAFSSSAGLLVSIRAQVLELADGLKIYKSYVLGPMPV